MVTAVALKAEGKVRRVGILDCDQHYGDETAEIMATLNIDWIWHISHEYVRPDDAKPFLDTLPRVVSNFADCDLPIDQAGAAPRINDPLGGFLTAAELVERD